MSPDTLKKFVVKISFDGKEGSGVLFKPEKNSRYSYIITAKHTFFTNDEEEINNKEKKEIKSDDITITRETSENNKITIYNNTMFFIDKNHEKGWIDLAFLIIKNSDNEKIGIISTLEIQDTEEDDNTNKEEFCIIGYPKNSEELENKINPYRVKYHQGSENEEIEYKEEFRSSDGGISFRPMPDQVVGISGGGVFSLSHNIPLLRSIETNCKSHNIFIATKIDYFIDDINSILQSIEKKYEVELDPIRCGKSLMIGNEELNVNEYTDFNFLKEQVEKEKENVLKKFIENNRISSDNDLRKISKNARGMIKKINNEREELSLIYIHLALLSHKKSKRHATTRYFKQAIELNKKHKQIFLLEKHKREKNTFEELKLETDGESIEDKISRLSLLLKEDNNNINTVKIIIREIDGYNKKHSDFISNQRKYYITNLEKIIINDKKIRDQYKYIQLADFFYSLINFKSEAHFFYRISIKVIEGLGISETNENKKIIELFSKKIEEIEKEGGFNKIDKNIDEKINYILIHKEEYLNANTKKILYKIYDETLFLMKENKKNEQNSMKINSEVNTIKKHVEKFETEITSRMDDCNEGIVSINENIIGIYPTIENIESTSNNIIESQKTIENTLIDSEKTITEQINDINYNVKKHQETDSVINKTSLVHDEKINEIRKYNTKNIELSENIKKSFLYLNNKIDNEIKTPLLTSLEKVEETVRSSEESLRKNNDKHYNEIKKSIDETMQKVDSSSNLSNEIRKLLLSIDKKAESNFYCINEFKQSLSKFLLQFYILRQESVSKKDIEHIIMSKVISIETLINEKHENTNRLINKGNMEIAKLEGIDHKIQSSYARCHSDLRNLLTDIGDSIKSLGTNTEQSASGLMNLIESIDNKSEKIKERIINSYSSVENKIVSETSLIKSHHNEKLREIRAVDIIYFIAFLSLIAFFIFKIFI